MMKTRQIKTDVLIIGGGTAGCYAAITLGKEKGISVVIAEMANIERSGCLAAGLSALNAYITKGHVPQDYVDYAMNDADGIAQLRASLCRRAPTGNYGGGLPYKACVRYHSYHATTTIAASYRHYSGFSYRVLG